MDTPALHELHRRIKDHLFNHLLPFWTGPALDREQGGWMAWMSNDLRVDRAQPKGLILNARLLWSFSAAYGASPSGQYRQMAERALAGLLDRFWDSQHGGAFWRVGGNGHVLDDAKKIYGQAFCIYALAEYARACGLQPALARALEVFVLIERHAHDPRHGGYIEVCRRDWGEAADLRLSEKDQNEKKSMNNHLHLLEAYANLFRVWPDPRVAERLRELISLFEQRILDPHTRHFHHFFNQEWQVRSDTCTFGHDIEGSWLLCEAAAVLGDAALVRRVEGLALEMAAVVLREGIEADGGLCYEGKAGQVIDRGKEWWPQAEALVGFLNAYQISRDAKYLEAARGVWSFIEEHLVDRVHGEWFWRIKPDGQPDMGLPKVSEWKDPYHGLRACLEAMQRLRQISGLADESAGDSADKAKA